MKTCKTPVSIAWGVYIEFMREMAKTEGRQMTPAEERTLKRGFYAGALGFGNIVRAVDVTVERGQASPEMGNTVLSMAFDEVIEFNERLKRGEE